MQGAAEGVTSIFTWRWRPAWASQSRSATGQHSQPCAIGSQQLRHALTNAAASAPVSARPLSILHFNDVYNIEAREQEPVGGAAKFVTKIRQLQQVRDSECRAFALD